MAFLMNERLADDDRYDRFINWFRTGRILREDEDEPSPLLRHEVYGKKLNTVADLLDALSFYQEKYSDCPVLLVVSSCDKGFYSLRSCEIENGRLVFQFKQEEHPAEPVPVPYVIDGIISEMKKLPDKNAARATEFRFACNGRSLDVLELALDVMRFPDDPQVFCFLNVKVRAGGEAASVQKAAQAASAPQTVGQFVSACEQLKVRSGRNGLLDQPVVFEIPSVPDRSIADEIDEIPEEFRQAVGQLCVVDYASPAKSHAKIELMGFDRFKEIDSILNGGEFSVRQLLDDFRRFEANLALFFMYSGKPYEIDEMKAEPGKPMWITLVPWGSLDESRRPLGEIEEWAACCRRNVLDWQR